MTLLVRGPDRPDVAVLGEILGRWPIAVRRPADDVVDGVKPCGRPFFPPCCTPSVRERGHIEQHRHTAVRLRSKREGLLDEGIGQAMTIGRIASCGWMGRKDCFVRISETHLAGRDGRLGLWERAVARAGGLIDRD